MPGSYSSVLVGGGLAGLAGNIAIKAELGWSWAELGKKLVEEVCRVFN